MQVDASSAGQAPRSARIGAKVLLAYMPLTALGILAVVLTISTSRCWTALLGGHVYIVLWAAQIAITNLFIVVVRFDRWFFGKALALSVASALLLPVIAQSEHQLRWLIIGKPDFASYVEKSTDSRCKIVGVDRQRRMRYEYSYVVEATLKCAGESKTRSCKWLFWHDKFRKEWKETFSLSLPLTCVPGEL